ncbi:MAG TPA: nucleotidyltransferase family protein [Sphingomicrobium sp.]|nr:nucleotidyltransferase family protein [Sphingomicrobium sp.]
MDIRASDAFLADTLRAPPAAWPAGRDGEGASDRLFERVCYHGIAGLLIDIGGVGPCWPHELRRRIHGHAIGQAMWEARHQAELARLLGALAERDLEAILLKGTAIAYDLYGTPSARLRGDSDLLVREDQLGEVRQVLRALGCVRHLSGRPLPDRLELQESWAIEAPGSRQLIDLHWSALNSLALRNVLRFDQIRSALMPLPRLSKDAVAADRPILLLHTCLHRAMHCVSPYFVDGVTYYGGDRLIWLYDIRLLAAALSEEQWEAFLVLAHHTGTSAPCREGLSMAKLRLGSRVPDAVMARLASGERSSASSYLRGGQLRRSSMDVLAVPGLRDKLRLIGGRLFPGGAFLRAKYPRMARMPIAILQARRFADMLRDRPRQGSGQ